MGESKWLGSLNHLIDMKCSVMIERSWVGTSIRPEHGGVSPSVGFKPNMVRKIGKEYKKVLLICIISLFFL